MKPFFSIAEKVDYLALLVGSILFFLFGASLNYYFPTNLFFLKYCLLVGIFDSVLICAKQYSAFLHDGLQDFVADPVLSAEKRKFINDVFSSNNLIVASCTSIFFVSASVLLNFVNIDPLGILSLISLFASIFISIIGYMLFVHLLRILIRISESDIDNFSRFYPAKTKWLVEITKQSAFYQTAFFIVGTMYVVLFTIHAPNDTIKILTTAKVASFSDVVLSFAWAIIIVAVIIGFPIINYIRGKAIRKVVSNFKNTSIQYYESVIHKIAIEKQLEYIKILKEIIESANYPVENKINLAVSTITILVNLVIALLKVFPSISALYNQ